MGKYMFFKVEYTLAAEGVCSDRIYDDLLTITAPNIAYDLNQ